MSDGQKQTGYAMVLSVGASVLAVARDVTVNRSATAIDATTRGGNGWREKCQGLKEWGLSTDAVWIPDDAAYTLVRDAFNNGTVLAVEITDTDGNKDTGSAFVTDLSRPEPLDDVVSVNIEMVGNGALVYTPHV